MNQYRRRIERVLSNLKEQTEESALLLSSAPAELRSRDSDYPYRQNSDLYYLTGSLSPGVSLLIKGSAKKPVLFAPPLNKQMVVWEGKSEDPKGIASRIGAELVITAEIKRELLRSLLGVRTLLFQNLPRTMSFEVMQHLLETPSHALFNLPKQYHLSDLLMEELRLYKDSQEISLIQHAANCTAEAMVESLDFVNARNNERDIAAAIEYGFKKRGCQVAFQTIVGSGRSAATLHYVECNRELKKGEMVLIDCGAEYNLYAGDITRVVPVGGRFSDWQRDLYTIVLDSQIAALKTIRAGVTVEKVYNTAAKVLTEGLVYLGVLKGKTSKLLAEKAFKPFFPHGIGHSLGLDVHDIGELRGKATLEKGMVFTVEPGLYFPKRAGYIPASGVRIEDDVVVTEKGCTVLTSLFPKEIDEIEGLMGKTQ